MPNRDGDEVAVMNLLAAHLVPLDEAIKLLDRPLIFLEKLRDARPLGAQTL